jgi:hypothetical protein
MMQLQFDRKNLIKNLSNFNKRPHFSLHRASKIIRRKKQLRMMWLPKHIWKIKEYNCSYGLILKTELADSISMYSSMGLLTGCCPTIYTKLCSTMEEQGSVIVEDNLFVDSMK